MLPGSVAVGFTVIVNGELFENETRVLSTVGIASITRIAVDPTATAVLLTSATFATFAALATAAFVKLTASVFASATAVIANAPLASFCANPAITTTSPTTNPCPVEVSVAILLAITIFPEIVFAVSASSPTVT